MAIVEPGAPPVAIPTAPEGGASDLGEARPLRADVWRRFRRNRLAMIGLIFLVLIVLVAVFAPLIAPYSITERTSSFRQGPSADHWFGTDDIGRDVFSRVVYGARVSLRIGFIATAISLVIASTAPFEAVYAVCDVAAPIQATKEATLMIEPPPESIIAGMPYLQPWATPFTLTARVVSQTDSSVAWIEPSSPSITPALLYRIVSPP